MIRECRLNNRSYAGKQQKLCGKTNVYVKRIVRSIKVRCEKNPMWDSTECVGLLYCMGSSSHIHNMHTYTCMHNVTPCDVAHTYKVCAFGYPAPSSILIVSGKRMCAFKRALTAGTPLVEQDGVYTLQLSCTMFCRDEPVVTLL